MVVRHTTGPRIPKHCTSCTPTTATTNEQLLSDDGKLSFMHWSYMPSPPIKSWILPPFWPWQWHPHMIYTEGSSECYYFRPVPFLYPQYVLIGSLYWFCNQELSNVINSNYGNSNLIANNHWLTLWQSSIHLNWVPFLVSVVSSVSQNDEGCAPCNNWSCQ
jgi:hypothetical protein